MASYCSDNPKDCDAPFCVCEVEKHPPLPLTTAATSSSAFMPHQVMENDAGPTMLADLRACKACQKSKCSCSLTTLAGAAAEACSRCKRLGIRCEPSAPRRRACTACRKAKERCKWDAAVSSTKCVRCTRLGLECVCAQAKRRAAATSVKVAAQAAAQAGVLESAKYLAAPDIEEVAKAESHRAHLRPTPAPAPDRGAAKVAALGSIHLELEGLRMEDGRAGANQSLPRPGRTCSTTCQGCKQAKVACTGGDPGESRPCTRCVRLNIPCVWAARRSRSNTLACVHCRRRKVACRRPNGANDPCERCLVHGLKCTMAIDHPGGSQVTSASPAPSGPQGLVEPVPGARTSIARRRPPEPSAPPVPVALALPADSHPSKSVASTVSVRPRSKRPPPARSRSRSHASAASSGSSPQLCAEAAGAERLGAKLRRVDHRASPTSAAVRPVRLSEMQIDGLDASPLEHFAWVQQHRQQQQRLHQRQLEKHAGVATPGQAQPAWMPSQVQGLPPDELARSPVYSNSNVLLDNIDDGLLFGAHGIIHDSEAGATSSVALGCHDAQEVTAMEAEELQLAEKLEWPPMVWGGASSACTGDTTSSGCNSTGLDLDNSFDLDPSFDLE